MMNGRLPYRVAAARSQAGAVLLEVLVSILIFSVGILAVIGLQANGVAGVADAKYRIDAAAAAEAMMGRIWGDQANLASYTAGSPYALAALPNGSMTVVSSPMVDPLTGVALSGIEAGNRVSVTVTWDPPGGGHHQYRSDARVYSR